jgi:hypothetical protein
MDHVHWLASALHLKSCLHVDGLPDARIQLYGAQRLAYAVLRMAVTDANAPLFHSRLGGKYINRRTCDAIRFLCDAEVGRVVTTQWDAVSDEDGYGSGFPEVMTERRVAPDRDLRFWCDAAGVSGDAIALASRRRYRRQLDIMAEMSGRLNHMAA